MPRDAPGAAGLSLSRGQVSPLAQPRHWSGMYSTAEAAVLLGVAQVTIRQWRFKGWLKPQGLDERNRPLHTREALRDAEALVTRHGIEASGVNPRTLRGKTAAREVLPASAPELAVAEA